MPLPPALSRSAAVAVAAPASAPLTPADLRAGLAALRARGLRVEMPAEAAMLADDFAPHGYLAAPDAARLAELNGLLRRDDLDALFVVRGGYGVLRLLPGLSGPMVAPDWPHLDAESEAQFWRLAEGHAPVAITGPGGEALEAVRPGRAEGVLLGGNLTMLASLLGTPYLPDLHGAILYLEEVGEPPYRVDRLLAQLRLAGVLENLGGLVLGGFTGCEPPQDRPSLPLDAVLADYTAGLPFPVARGLVYGHFRRKSTLPFGVRARLEADAGTATLTVLDPVTARG